MSAMGPYGLRCCAESASEGKEVERAHFSDIGLARVCRTSAWDRMARTTADQAGDARCRFFFLVPPCCLC